MLLSHTCKMGFMTVSLVGEGERLLSENIEIVLDGQSHFFLMSAMASACSYSVYILSLMIQLLMTLPL